VPPERKEDITVLRTTITAAGAAAALAVLTACGGPVQMGAAAVTGNGTISAATLSAQVANLTAAYRASHGRVSYQFPASRAPQQVLSWLVRFQVRDQLAARRGVTVTPAQAQRALAAARSQASQSGVDLTDLAVANGLPPDLLPALGRYQAIESAVVRQLDGGRMPTSQSGLQALGREFSREQCLAAKSLGIRINPQFGQLNYAQLAVVPAASTLSAPAGMPASQPQQPGPAC
jgi:hypothetical protein